MHLDRHVEPAGSWVVVFDAWVRDNNVGYLTQWNLYGSKGGCHLQITHDYATRPYSEEEYAAFSKTQYEIAKRHNNIPNTHHESVVTIYDMNKGEPLVTTYELMWWLSKEETNGHTPQTLRSGDEVKREELPRTDEGTGGV